MNPSDPSPGPLTEDERRELARLEAEATPPAWGEGDPSGLSVSALVRTGHAYEQFDQSDFTLIEVAEFQGRADAALTSAARNVLPRLIAESGEAARLREENDGLRRLCGEAAPDLIYSILRAECGAPVYLRDDFARYMLEPGDHSREFRFGGILGGGGKFYDDRRGEWRVGCYRQDDTPERIAAIDRTNELLRKLSSLLRSASSGEETA